jgi:transketolase
MKNRSEIITKKIRKKILILSYKAQSAHIASSFSIVDLITVLYLNIINKNLKNIFILSKGHACLAHYCLLNEFKIISDKVLNTYGKNNSILMSHSSHKVKGVNLSTGSLGHGLPVATGIALSNLILKKKEKVFVLLSDGELNEGSNWESILFASHHKLKNLVIIIDYNKIQSLDYIKNTIKLEPLKQKFSSFGCDVISINGHNHLEIFKALKKKTTKPLVIIANTIKGKGVSFMENKVLWHYRSPSKIELEKGLKELNL